MHSIIGLVNPISNEDDIRKSTLYCLYLVYRLHDIGDKKSQLLLRITIFSNICAPVEKNTFINNCAPVRRENGN